MASNYATTITARQYYATHAAPPPIDPTFQHKPAGSKPTEPTFPDYLNYAEQVQFLTWKAYPWQRPILPHAIAKMIEFEAYYASPSYMAWKVADGLSRVTLWKWLHADSLDSTTATVAPSADDTGVGSGAPAKPIPPSPN